MSDGIYLRRRKKPAFQHSQGTGSWCHRPIEEHILNDGRDRSHVGDIWMCDECETVWIAVLRPSLLDGVPHWAVKWKRMPKWRAERWKWKKS